jgi:hypothetical protein
MWYGWRLFCFVLGISVHCGAKVVLRREERYSLIGDCLLGCIAFLGVGSPSFLRQINIIASDEILNRSHSTITCLTPISSPCTPLFSAR